MTDGPRSFTADELAGIIDMFGALTPDELCRACDELSFRETGETPARETITETIDEAVDGFHLARVPDGEEPLLLAGPSAFPRLPPGAEDLPHILDIEERSVDRTAVASSLLETIDAELQGDPSSSRRHDLVGVTYDLESWADIDAAAVRAANDDA